MTFCAGRTGPLNSHGNDHLTDRRAIRGCLLAARPINEPNQIQLLGNPYQSACITYSLCADGTHQSQISNGCWIGRAQNGLPRKRAIHFALKMFISFI
jgi:hypothetical protein